MVEVVNLVTWFYRLFGALFMVLGLAALFLAGVGLYGVVSFSVARRSQEMGIRLALGARPDQLVWLVLRRGLRQLAIGLAIGLTLAALAAGPLQFVLFDVRARDPVIFGTVVAALACLGVAAALLPARRAARVAPAAALAAS